MGLLKMLSGWFNKNYVSPRYLELFWEYPMPSGTRCRYDYNFTNYPRDCNRSMGNGGRGYECYDLYNQKHIQDIINMIDDEYDYKVSYYLENKVIDKSLKIYERWCENGTVR